MLPLILAATLLSAGATLALPSNKRQSIKPEDNSSVGSSDVSILNYALTLENLEATFYSQGLQNFTQAQFAVAGFDAAFYNNLVEVSKDEGTHVKFLTDGLTAAGAKPVSACTYNFPYTDVPSFIALASILEGVGVSAYLGAAADIASPDYLTAAGAILTIEARHSSYLRSHLNESPFPQPFDVPLDFNQVYSLAAPFFVSCPSSNPPLGVKPFPSLKLATPGPITPGMTITLNTTSYVLADPQDRSGGQLYGAFVTIAGPVFEPATEVPGGYSVTVPQGVAGQTYVVLTACNEKLTDQTTAAGPAIVEISV